VILRNNGTPYESERIVPIVFRGHTIGNLRADLIVDQRVVLEFKSLKSLTAQAETQAANYLKLTGLSHAYVVNFPPCGTQGVEVRAVGSP
jgi:GxxExxY protein